MILCLLLPGRSGTNMVFSNNVIFPLSLNLETSFRRQQRGDSSMALERLLPIDLSYWVVLKESVGFYEIRVCVYPYP